MRRFLQSLVVRLALAACVVGSAPGLVSEAHAQAGVRIEALDFDGNRRYDEDTLRLALRSKKGQILDRALLQEDINTLYGFFDTVELDETQTATGLRLRFVVTENPLIREVRLDGIDQLSRKEVTAVMETRSGRPLAQFRVDNDARKITRLFRDRGYHFVEVNSRVEDVGEDKRVVFTILEGPSVDVDEILFEGNDAVSRDDLLDHMATREPGFLGLGGSSFVEETVRLDLLTLRNYLRSEGWLDANVDLVDLDFSDDRGDVTVRIGVTEGNAYTVGNVFIQGADSYPGGVDALLELVRLESGDRRRQAGVGDTVSALERAYREEGFFAALVLQVDKLPAEGHVVDLVFTIEEQSKVRVRRLDILGNTITRDKVIRRDVSVFPGGVLNQNEIDKSVRRLQSLRYFQRVAYTVNDVAEGDPNEKDIVFQVDDSARTGQVRFAAGVSSDLGFIGSITITKRNFDWRDTPESFGEIFSGDAFSGGGQTLAIELAPGSELSSYRVAFTEPWLFDKPISFGWDVFLSKFSRFDYDVDRRGVNVSLGRRFTFEGKKQDTVLGLTTTSRVERHEVDNVDRETAPNAFLAEDDLSLIAQRLNARVDRLDNSAEPSTGWFAEASTEVGFAGDVRLWKNELEGRRFWVVHRDEEEREHVLSIGGRLAYAQELSSSESAEASLLDEDFVPIYERYRAGGSSSIRGFEFGGAGPHGEGDPRLAARPRERFGRQQLRLGETARSILDNDGDPMGGDVLLTASAEYQFPLYETILKGVVFCDAGMVRDDFGSSHGLEESDVASLRRRLLAGNTRQRRLGRQLTFDDGPSFLDDMRVSVGVGLRIRIPAFGQQPIALDLGFPIREQDGDDRQVLSFTIARDF